MSTIMPKRVQLRRTKGSPRERYPSPARPAGEIRSRPATSPIPSLSFGRCCWTRTEPRITRRSPRSSPNCAAATWPAGVRSTSPATPTSCSSSPMARPDSLHRRRRRTDRTTPAPAARAGPRPGRTSPTRSPLGGNVASSQALGYTRNPANCGVEYSPSPAGAALVRRGRPSRLPDLLAPVYGWFTEGFETADLNGAPALPVTPMQDRVHDLRLCLRLAACAAALARRPAHSSSRTLAMWAAPAKMRSSSARSSDFAP
jgi:hypothetical protein